jgi:DNA-binding LacI/PurR family transcriptional regulator
MIAAGVLQAIREVGLSIPEDISVIGFDDTLSEYLSPLLTTVRLPAQELGQTAAKLLIDQLEGKEKQRGQLIELDAELIVRQSTAKA